MYHCSINVYIAMSIIGISAGLMAGVCFAYQYHNVSTTIMAFTSSAFAAYVTYMHFAYKRNTIMYWSSTRLRMVFWIGSLVFVGSFVGMIGCLIAAGVMHQTITEDGLQGENLWMTSVWCFMTAKWSSFAAMFARRYSNTMLTPLVKSQPIHAPSAELY